MYNNYQEHAVQKGRLFFVQVSLQHCFFAGHDLKNKLANIKGKIYEEFIIKKHPQFTTQINLLNLATENEKRVYLTIF